jgi:hypothetical protein
MNRSLKLSARPFIVFGVLYGSLSILVLVNYFRLGMRADQLSPALVLLALYVANCALVSSKRVTVSPEGITIKSWFVFKRFVPFRDIDHSDVQILAERDWPIMLSIFKAGHSNPLETIGLKAIRKEDAAWLCSLPQIKAVIHPGLTRKRKGELGSQ